MKRKWLSFIDTASLRCALLFLVFLPPASSSAQNSTRLQLPPFVALLEVADYLKLELSAAGYWLGEGRFTYFEKEHCAKLVELVGQCYGQNPLSPYGIYLLPRGPGEFPDERMPGDLFLEGAEGLYPAWRLRPDEAIIMLGLTPPRVKYFGYQSYLFTRLVETSPDVQERLDLFASLGRSINHLTIDSTGSLNDPFNRGTVVITTADGKLESLLRERISLHLSLLGFSDNIINTDIIPADKVNLGYGEEADDFQTIARLALPENELQAKLYREAPPVILLRIVPGSPPGSASIEPLSALPIPDKGTGLNEDYLKPALKALESGVKRRFLTPSRQYLACPALELEFLNGENCMAKNIPCLGDTHDTTYVTHYATSTLKHDADDFAVIIGANHTETGKATYSSLSVYNSEKRMGIGGVKDSELMGSALPYIPYIPALKRGRDSLIANSDKVYAYMVARNCGGNPNCLTIPGGDLGIELEEQVRFIVRAYIEPGTTQGPAYSEVLGPRFIWFKHLDENAPAVRRCGLLSTRAERRKCHKLKRKQFPKQETCLKSSF